MFHAHDGQLESVFFPIDTAAWGRLAEGPSNRICVGATDLRDHFYKDFEPGGTDVLSGEKNVRVDTANRLAIPSVQTRQVGVALESAFLAIDGPPGSCKDQTEARW